MKLQTGSGFCMDYCSGKEVCNMAGIMQADGLMEKLTVLSDAAKYDVACTSSGVQRGGDGKHTGNTSACGICHTFAGDGRCISLLKILLSNECVYDCKYCVNRVSNDIKRASFTPEEVCRLTMEFYRRNYIEGLFLSSGIIQSPDHTMGLLYETLFLLRSKYQFHGYIHVKGIPGASAEVVEMVGYLADRMSVNLEMPTAEGLRTAAPNKVRKNILFPMRQIQNGIKESRQYHGISSMKSRMYIDEKSYYEQMAQIRDSYERLQDYQSGIKAIREKNAPKTALTDGGLEITPSENRTSGGLTRPDRYFVPAGQSTQMIIGATGETDYQIISVTEALYQRFEMKRVFYSAFVNINQDSALLQTPQGPPLLREHRLYQADYYTLLRVPGIGTKSARRILAARRNAKLGFEDIKKMGVVLKRALYFITCQGHMLYHTKLEKDYITRQLAYEENPVHLLLSDGSSQSYKQLSLFEESPFYQALQG